MRQLGILLIQIKTTNSEIQQLESCLVPQNFDLVLNATKSGKAYSMNNCTNFKIPSLPLKLVTL